MNEIKMTELNIERGGMNASFLSESELKCLLEWHPKANPDEIMQIQRDEKLIRITCGNRLFTFPKKPKSEMLGDMVSKLC